MRTAKGRTRSWTSVFSFHRLKPSFPKTAFSCRLLTGSYCSQLLQSAPVVLCAPHSSHSFSSPGRSVLAITGLSYPRSIRRTNWAGCAKLLSRDIVDISQQTHVGHHCATWVDNSIGVGEHSSHFFFSSRLYQNRISGTDLSNAQCGSLIDTCLFPWMGEWSR